MHGLKFSNFALGSIKAQRSQLHSPSFTRLFTTTATPSSSRLALTPVRNHLSSRNMSTTTVTVTTQLTPSQAAAAALATIDLKGYDAEQTRLMSERCILVDEQDRPLGAADKKTCEHTHLPCAERPSHITYQRPPNGEHKQRSPASCILRLRLPA